MNIFVLSMRPDEIAKWQMDKHCVKMPLESAMMLSAAHRILDGLPISRLSPSNRLLKHYELSDDREHILYRVSHINHPCTVWTRTSLENYMWHYQLFVAMLIEYEYRYLKHHACWKLEPLLRTPPIRIDRHIGPTPHSQAMPEYLRISDNPVMAYHNYYRQEKQHLAKWTKRPIPDWYLDAMAVRDEFPSLLNT